MSTTQKTARWYMIDKDGMATLCTDREDAEKEAKDANMAWPHTAPHRAVQLVEVGTSARGLIDAAQAVIDRWDTPLWKDAPATAGYIAALREALEADRAMRAAQPAGAQQPDTAYAELPSYEHQRAIMEAERNASLDEYSRIVPLTSTESMIYERAFTNGWNRHASHGQAPAQAAPVEVADAMADSQYLAGVSAGWNAANADDPNAALQKLHESRAGYLQPLRAARAPADSVTAPAATVIKKGAERQWMSERLGHLPDGIYSLYLAPPAQAADSVLEDAAPTWRCQHCIDRHDGIYGSWAAPCPYHDDDGKPRIAAARAAQEGK